MSDDASASGNGIHESKNKYTMTGARLTTIRMIMERFRVLSVSRIRQVCMIWEGCAPGLDEGPMIKTRLKDTGIKSRIMAKSRNKDSFQFNTRALF
jgi:hypothetical protein